MNMPPKPIFVHVTREPAAFCGDGGWTNFRNFVLHCLVRGEIVKLDLGELREMNTLLRNVSNNINRALVRAIVNPAWLLVG